MEFLDEGSEQQTHAHTEKMVMEKIKDIIDNGGLKSSTTKQPLTDQDKGVYFARATFYFIEETKKWKSCKNYDGNLPPIYNTILSYMQMEESWIGETLKAIVEDICKTPRRDEDKFQEYLDKLRKEIMPQGKNRFPDTVHESNLSELTFLQTLWGHAKENVVAYFGGAGGVATFGRAVVTSIADEMLLALDGVFKPYNIAHGARFSAQVGGVYLCGVTLFNLYKCARGRRSLKRAGKNILEETVAVGAGFGVGVAVSALLAPLTGGVSLLCGAVAGIFANWGTRVWVKKYTGKLFNLPEDETLEIAYKTLGITDQCVENDLVGSRYRREALRFHPDKFNQRNPNATANDKLKNLRRHLKVQAALAMIMAARNDNADEYTKAKENFEKIEEEEELDKGTIDVAIKIWAARQFDRVMSCFRTQKTQYPAIANGYLPVEFYEDPRDIDNNHDNKGESGSIIAG